MTARRIALSYKLVRLLLAIATPEVTMFELAMTMIGFVFRRGPPMVAS